VVAKRYASITVQDLLDRADVGRSTFYAHYRGKDDLLLTSFAAMLDMMDRSLGDGPGDRVAPVAELFRHVGASVKFHRALSRTHMLDRLYWAGADSLSGAIEPRLAARGSLPTSASAPVAVQARALSGALFAMLRWWVDAAAPYTPERMDELFHAVFRGGPASSR